MLAVVPGEEVFAEAPGLLFRSKAVREVGTVLEGLEVTFRKRIVVRDMRAAQAAGHTQIGEQQSHWFGGHRGTAIRMNRQLVQLNALLETAFPKQLFGQLRRFARGYHPARDIAAEDVQHHIEIVVSPFH